MSLFNHSVLNWLYKREAYCHTQNLQRQARNQSKSLKHRDLKFHSYPEIFPLMLDLWKDYNESLSVPVRGITHVTLLMSVKPAGPTLLVCKSLCAGLCCICVWFLFCEHACLFFAKDSCSEFTWSHITVTQRQGPDGGYNSGLEDVNSWSISFTFRFDYYFLERIIRRLKPIFLRFLPRPQFVIF